MSIDTRSSVNTVVAVSPRANLLPPEVALGIKAKSLRRMLVLLVLLAVVIAGAGVAASTLLAASSAGELASANDRTATLLAKQAEFSEVRQVTGMIAKAEAARSLGMSTEINWKSYIAEIQASLPIGTSIVTFAAEAATPQAAYSESTMPLEGERIGQLTFTGTSGSLPDVQAWLVSLSKVTGFVDGAPGTVSLDDSGMYTVGIVMHFDAGVLTNRFAEPETDEDTSK